MAGPKPSELLAELRRLQKQVEHLTESGERLDKLVHALERRLDALEDKRGDG